MVRLVLVTGIVLAMADYSFAQFTPDAMQCQQIRQAAAQYGYAAARRHAMETYGPEAVRAGDRCFTRQAGQSTRSHARRKSHVAHSLAEHSRYE